MFQPFVGFARFVHQLDAERKLIGPRSPLYRNALEAARPRAAGYVWGSPGSVEASRLRDTIVTGFHATNLRCLRSVGETYRRLCLLILLDCIRDRDIPPANSEQVDVKRSPGSRASLPDSAGGHPCLPPNICCKDDKNLPGTIPAISHPDSLISCSLSAHDALRFSRT